MNITCTPEEFVATLADHVPDTVIDMRFAISGYLHLVQKHGPLPLCFCCWGNTSARAHDGWAGTFHGEGTLG